MITSIAHGCHFWSSLMGIMRLVWTESQWLAERESLLSLIRHHFAAIQEDAAVSYQLWASKTPFTKSFHFFFLSRDAESLPLLRTSFTRLFSSFLPNVTSELEGRTDLQWSTSPSGPRVPSLAIVTGDSAAF